MSNNGIGKDVTRSVRFPSEVAAALDAEKRKRAYLSVNALIVEAVREKYMASEAVLKEV